MARFRHGSLAVLIALLAFLSAVYGNDRGRVLCVGDDGHVALEAALNGVCGFGAVTAARSGVQDGREGSVAAFVASHCGPCVDYPFVVGNADLHDASLRFHNANQGLVAGGAPAVPARPTLHEPCARTLRCGSRQDPPDPTYVSLRNTVLLI